MIKIIHFISLSIGSSKLINILFNQQIANFRSFFFLQLNCGTIIKDNDDDDDDDSLRIAILLRAREEKEEGEENEITQMK